MCKTKDCIPDYPSNSVFKKKTLNLKLSFKVTLRFDIYF